MPSSPPTDVAAIAGTSGAARTAKRYRVFLSYSHADTTWARWLMGRLERYRVPRRFHGRTAPIGEVGPRLAPVFRDRDELPTTSDLGETIRAALRESETLVVICSPAAAKSRWVREEILAFKRLHGERRVFAFIVGGEPKAEGTADDCFSPALRAEIGTDAELAARPAEIVAADARPQGDGREDALLRLIAGLLGVGFDELRQRELGRRRRRLGVGALAAAAAIGLIALAWQARHDALRRQEGGEELVAFLLDDLKTKVEKSEKLDALDKAGARILAYFQSLKPRDLTDTTLAQQAKALNQIGQIRITQMRYADANAALAGAFERLAALASRNPTNAELLFERAQAEYWIAFVLRRAGNINEMTEWFRRYRDTGAAMVALDAAEPRWQQELAYGHHNLAVVDFDTGKLAAARRGFLAEVDLLAKLSGTNPNELKLQNQIADANSWLGSVAERSGDFTEAAKRFAEHVAQLETIARAEPENAKWKARLADAFGLHATVLAINGARDEARKRRAQARSLFESLVARDAKNLTWQRSLLWLRLKEAELIRADGDLPAAETLLAELRGNLEQMSAAETKDIGLVNRMTVACRLHAETLALLGRAGAADAAAQAVAFAERLIRDQNANELYAGDTAQAHVTAGRIAARDGKVDDARQHWLRALEVLGPRVTESNHWRLLFPAAQAFFLLGRTSESRTIVERLRGFGFHPTEPWPEETTGSASPTNLNP